MAKKEKINMPPSMAGLMTYYDEEGAGFKIKPEHLIAGAAVVVVFEIMLHLYGAAWI